jgi:outer membrane protein insertion porin family
VERLVLLERLTRFLRITLIACLLPTGVVSSAAQAPAVVPSSAADPITPKSPGSLQGRIVSEIRLLSSTETEPSQSLLSTLEQRVGDPFDRTHLRSSVRALYASGRFADVQVDAEPALDGGIRLTFLTTPNYFNGSIRVTGLPKGGPTETQLVHSTRLGLGELFTEQKLQDSINRMLRIMEDNGYYRARITCQRQASPETQQIHFVFNVVPGERAVIGKVTVNGDSGMKPEKVARLGGMVTGKPVKGDVVVRFLNRLRKVYTKQDRLAAQLTNTSKTYNARNNSVDYVFQVDRGPVVDLRVEGARVGRGQLRRYVPIYEENAVDDDLLNEGRRNLRDYLQTQGYFNAQIDVKQVPEGKDKLHVVYEVDRGERHRLTSIEIEGNKAIMTENIRELLFMQPASFLMRKGRFSQAILGRDVAAVKNFYTSNGYINADVSGEVLKGAKADDLRVVLHIKEGSLVKVHSLTVTGNSAITSDTLSSQIDLAVGQPFSETTMSADHDAIVTTYFNAGYPEVQMESTYAPTPGDENARDVWYTIHEGPRVMVDRVLVAGVENTKPRVVNREMRIKEGGPLSQDRMLQTQRGLYDLGIFTEVGMAVQNPDGQDKSKNVLYQIDEAKRYTFDYGLGIEVGTGVNQSKTAGPQGSIGASPRFSFDVTRLNFRGRDQSIIFKSHIGNLQKRALLSFDEPRWWDLEKWRLTLTTFYDNTRNVTTFASERLEGSIQLQQVVSRASQFLYTFAYRRVKVDPNSFPAGFTPDLIPLYSQPVRVGIPSITYIRDTRDNPVDSRKGTYNTIDLAIASGAVGSEANFGRVIFQNSTYHGFGKKKALVLARNTRIGMESPYGDSVIVPVPERFFVGGANSLRGFSMNQAGPRDLNTGSPLGGNATIVNNLELRFPPPQLPFIGDSLSFILFHDMGNSFDTSKHLFSSLATWHQPGQEFCRNLDANAGCNFNFISHAVGTGIRYHTPIGPVRFDLGYNLNPTLYPVKQPSNGSAPYYDRVRRFNFYFSIGQTF